MIHSLPGVYSTTLTNSNTHGTLVNDMSNVGGATLYANNLIETNDAAFPVTEVVANTNSITTNAADFLLNSN